MTEAELATLRHFTSTWRSDDWLCREGLAIDVVSKLVRLGLVEERMCNAWHYRISEKGLEALARVKPAAK